VAGELTSLRKKLEEAREEQARLAEEKDEAEAAHRAKVAALEKKLADRKRALQLAEAATATAEEEEELEAKLAKVERELRLKESEILGVFAHNAGVQEENRLRLERTEELMVELKEVEKKLEKKLAKVALEKKKKEKEKEKEKEGNPKEKTSSNSSSNSK
jgi:hypothetical protein